MIIFRCILDWVLSLSLKIRYKYALLRELMMRRRIKFTFLGMNVDDVFAFIGLGQGRPESGYSCASIIAEKLCELSRKWKSENRGVFLGRFQGGPIAFDMWYEDHRHLLGQYDVEDTYVSSLAFLDDIQLLATTLSDAQAMLDDIGRVMLTLGLRLKTSKLKWLANRWAAVGADDFLIHDGKRIYRSDEIKILGSIVTGCLDEMPTVKHRCGAAWACYRKWAHILENQIAPINLRIRFWAKTVLRSLLWGLETTRELTLEAQAKLRSCQKWMVRKMLRLKRRPNKVGVGLEPWLDYHIRALTTAGKIVSDLGVCVLDNLSSNKQKWVNHVLRMGTAGKPPHLAKAVLLWRPRQCREFLRFFNDIPGLHLNTIKHPAGLGHPLRFEEQFKGKLISWFSL
jgi:hypothetical protein